MGTTRANASLESIFCAYIVLRFVRMYVFR